MIRFYIEQDPAYPFPKTYLPLMKRVIRTCVDEHYPNHRFEIERTTCGDNEIHRINREFRGIDRPTDVLSFPMMEFEMPEVYVSLGNIVISVETARRQAEEYGHSYEREVAFLTAHSVLHCLGYDHVDGPEQEKEMFSRQEAILEGMGLCR